ncbi:MAG: oxidoreductase, partial [Lentisphaeria bacterium]|nr:oxidoreductase [Lentisphaeria bacterium]
MKQTARIISIHAADTSGVCSMLYELGGMVVVHDASGCNSTYSTHDEPRWYRQDSMIYISALTETDAILGNDEKLIRDVVSAAKDLSPRFIALCGAPVPLLAGTDFPAIAAEIESRIGIPAFGLHTSGMRSYLAGASEALEAVVSRFCTDKFPRTDALSANIIGATPLDFSINGTVESMIDWLKKSGFELVSCMATGSTLDDIRRASAAHVNLVVSSCGLATAELLRERFGTPWVAGVPVGKKFPAVLASALKTSVETGECALPCADRDASSTDKKLAIPGETIFSSSLAAAIESDLGVPCRVLCPLEAEDRLLAPGDIRIFDEDAAGEAFA